jgi:CBS domain-containing protein
LQAKADGVCLHAPERFGAVSLYYTDFTQTGDEEVVALLLRAREEFAALQKENSMQTISDVMTCDVAVIGPNDNLQRAAQLMAEWDVGSLPVCDGRRLLGMITDRDITVRATAEGRGPDEVHVAEIMSEGLSYCFEDQRVGEVLQQMGDEQIRRMPVLDRNMQLCGMVAIGDIAIRDDASVDHAMDEISMPARPNRPSADEMRRGKH